MKTIAQQLNIKSFPFEVKDDNGNILYTENSDGHWYKYTYDKNNNIIYYENNTGFWYKNEYDDKRNVIYYENSEGQIIDKRTKINKTNFFGVYSLHGELKSVHYTEEGAEENKLKCEKRYSEGFYVDYVVIHK